MYQLRFTREQATSVLDALVENSISGLYVLSVRSQENLDEEGVIVSESMTRIFDDGFTLYPEYPSTGDLALTITHFGGTVFIPVATDGPDPMFTFEDDNGFSVVAKQSDETFATYTFKPVTD